MLQITLPIIILIVQFSSNSSQGPVKPFYCGALSTQHNQAD